MMSRTTRIRVLTAVVSLSVLSVSVDSYAAMAMFQEDFSPTGAYQAGAAYIDNNSPTSVFNNASIFVGAITPSSRITRGLLSFDISSIPAGSTINSISLDMTVNSPDGSSASEDHTITVHELTTPFDEEESTWNEAETGTAWSTAGGDFSATVLSSVVANPNTVAADSILAFATSVDFVSAAQGALDGSGTLSLLLDSDSNTDDDRGLFRLRGDDLSEGPSTKHPKLTIDFTPIPEPSSLALLLLSVLGLVCIRR